MSSLIWPHGSGAAGATPCVPSREGPPAAPVPRPAAVDFRIRWPIAVARRRARHAPFRMGTLSAHRMKRYDQAHVARHATVAEEEYLQTIFWLQEAGLPMTGANVARAMQLSAPTVHEMIGRLERDGYVTRGADKVLALHRQRPRARGGRRPPPPADRALPHRRPGDPVGRGARGGRAARARDVPRARGAHAARRSATRRPARTATRSTSATGSRRAARPTSSRARKVRDPALRERGRGPAALPQGRGHRARRGGRDRRDATTTTSWSTSAAGARELTRSVAETVSVIADPSPPPRTALPEQLVLSKDRYGR